MPDRITGSMERALAETRPAAGPSRRRSTAEHGIHAPDHQAQHSRHRRPHGIAGFGGGGYRRRGAQQPRRPQPARLQSKTSKSGCATRRPIWNSRKPDGCATKSGGLRADELGIPDGEKRRRRLSGGRTRAKPGTRKDALRAKVRAKADGGGSRSFPQGSLVASHLYFHGTLRPRTESTGKFSIFLKMDLLHKGRNA